VLRRSEGAKAEVASFDGDGLHIDFAEHRASVDGRDVDLTASEYRLLAQLASNAGRVMVHDELLRRVWGPGYEDGSELLHTAIRRLRRKIERDPAQPRHVVTKRGIGYLIAKEDR